MTVLLSTYRPRYEVERIGGSYCVRDPNGALLPARYASRQAALMSREDLQREADRKAKRGPRACMCCGATFQSDGIHNRLCTDCRAPGFATSATAGSTSTGKIRRAARA
ncbi:hypothetical protein [Gemmobacter serpentinus]|uniref:hypothetical protein n=1 Tax=Gemmobacter serpentinus TaxID=2652247 RepID=UPI00124E784A|nr:hypothetical protein [Gemmobacter serpentinus]